MDEVFDSVVRSAGDLAGVFECDGETAYFYLYDVNASEGKKIKCAIHIFSSDEDISEKDISVKWNALEDRVALFICDDMWAMFDATKNLGYGGNYKKNGHSALSERFDL